MVSRDEHAEKMVFKFFLIPRGKRHSLSFSSFPHPSPKMFGRIFMSSEPIVMVNGMIISGGQPAAPIATLEIIAKDAAGKVITRTQADANVTLKIKGTVSRIDLAAGQVYVNGAAQSVSTQTGNVAVKGKLGSANTMSGDVVAHYITQHVNTMTGDIRGIGGAPPPPSPEKMKAVPEPPPQPRKSRVVVEEVNDSDDDDEVVRKASKSTVPKPQRKLQHTLDPDDCALEKPMKVARKQINCRDKSPERRNGTAAKKRELDRMREKYDSVD